ncbi:LCP family protein [Zhihengliuella sp.]|uniref:LCP family protein n=1 Tax=Zhihengliuella sp. TaxID=1954483 RepID=UPI0028119F29|nr:LCP family protein [Zhihengliuella sp.]
MRHSTAARGLTDPVRYPNHAPAQVRTKRAFFLLLLTIFVPGGAQVVAGNRTLGRRALTVTLTCWALVLVALVVYFVDRSILLGLVARPAVQIVLAVSLLVLAVGWLLLFINTLAIIRPKLLAPGARGILVACTIAALVGTSGALGYGSFVVNEGRQTIGDVFATGPAFDPVDGRYNIMVMGGDAGEGRDGLRPDTMMLFSIDADSGRTAVISFPRNFQNAQFAEDSPMRQIYPTGYNCGDECIMNSLYKDVTDNHSDLYPESEDPGAEAMMDAAEGITGVKVQSYVLVDMAGFEKLIDAMGGVTVDSGGWVPFRGPERDDTFVRTRWFPPGELELDGAEALWFARSRYFTTDYHRIRRQQCLQQAMMKQFNPQTVLTRFSAIMSAGEELVDTDIPQDQLSSFLGLADKARQHPFERLTLGAPDFGTSADRFSTYPDFDQIRSRVDELLLAASDDAPEETPAPEESPEETPAEDTADAGASSEPAEETSAEAEPTEESNSIQGWTDSAPTTQPDGSPITEEYLIELEEMGREDILSLIADSNAECSA